MCENAHLFIFLKSKLTLSSPPARTAGNSNSWVCTGSPEKQGWKGPQRYPALPTSPILQKTETQREEGMWPSSLSQGGDPGPLPSLLDQGTEATILQAPTFFLSSSFCPQLRIVSFLLSAVLGSSLREVREGQACWQKRLQGAGMTS